jgi:hypothetical protein
MQKNILILLLTSFLFSCENRSNREKETARLVTEWQGKEIVFPNDMVFTRHARDTVDYRIADAAYKILTYVDSAGCTDCVLRLYEWKQFITHIDSVSNGSVAFLFFIHPKDYEEMYYVLDAAGFDHPVCIDLGNELDKLNHFSEKTRFRTFLLNNDNRVEVIGNPVYNDAVKELYIKQITKGGQVT